MSSAASWASEVALSGAGGVRALEYSDVSRPRAKDGELVAGVPEAEVQARVAAAGARERVALEERLGAEWREREAGLLATAEEAVERRVSEALARFAEERTDYFVRVETEIVGLTLAIARKILCREAALDPMLLSGLVRVALDGMERGTAVRLRVPEGRVEAWQRRVSGIGLRCEVEVVGDAGVGAEECVVETESGSAQLSWEQQMKEVERGFLDLLGQRPDLRRERSAQ